MPGQFEGKVALVTGGSSGIGRASALAFAREGTKVVVADVNVEGGEETVQKIEELGGEGIFTRADMSNTADVEAMVTKAVEAYGRLDCAFNNAGLFGLGSIVECTEQDWDRIMDVNLKGVWLCLKYEILQMLEQRGGVIVNTASVAGLVGGAGATPYVASKHGVVGLTKVAALEYADQGIRVNAVCPGLTRTPMIKDLLNTEREESSISRHPIGRLGTPEEIAEAVVWLCSDAASFVTGHAMPVDGGYVAQ